MLTRTRQRKNDRIGFTLMEVLLVMAILVILGSVVVMNFSKVFDDAKEDNAKIQLQALKIPLGMFKLHTGNFPSNDAGLGALLTAPGDVSEERWRGPYLPTKLEPDPWGNEYDYELTSEGYRIWSNGPDANSNKDDISVTSYDS
ncbi:MAG: prepilin-type N-terminal cleavage/methylation domain-containing protein [Planctomycetaceae bacterium]|jgi:general secretion pathway protein G|nr:prepilin-type N-terminal cleavage/methylation domain-containing protein [Planctomycetaceae bacterium]MBT4725438.1 prepilin-type N-terminal cleavage/methylation domain-containing protein [Planctomycetaceae bacterium]MBT4846959.1 prepilin-type N-terminal cleavage/methylation domain-containing protein [Planctomycetaceae bacterium]MBT5123191.1 prepilin-type N-terminal cleavage/methylation domain-containing protein [Planctomycetaceae bacterium]MBT5598875.1 prepilin-type N-terminal cleavage/methyl